MVPGSSTTQPKKSNDQQPVGRALSSHAEPNSFGLFDSLQGHEPKTEQAKMATDVKGAGPFQKNRQHEQ
jgi:hypothetical protein